jgi:hypothetical protein
MSSRPTIVGLLSACLGAGAVLLVPGTSGAQSARDDDAGDTNATAPAAAAAAGVGAFQPFTTSARGDTQRALGFFQGGYDSARRGSVFQAAAEVQVWGRLSLRGGGSYLGPSGQMQPDVAIKVDVLRQELHGVDVAAVAGYEAQGFNLIPAVVARAAIGRTLDRTRVTANVGYGIGTRAGERFGDLRMAAMQRLPRDLHLGLDSRFRIDLERDADEPAGEPEWELAAGPMVALPMGRFVLSAAGGATAIKVRLAPERHVGVYGLMGLGAVF